jgi:hypothetical protein
MPTKRIETKSKIEVLDLKNGKKQYYKTGSKKGQVKKKMKSPAKYKKELHVNVILDMFSEADIIILERQSPRPGNSAGSSFTTGINYGKLIALAELSGAKLEFVAPMVWKKYFNLHMTHIKKKKLTPTEYKKLSIQKAYELSEWNTSYDGIADSICIGHWFCETKLKDEKNDNTTK